MIGLLGPAFAVALIGLIVGRSAREFGSTSVTYAVFAVGFLVPAAWFVFLLPNGILAIICAICGVLCLVGVFASRKPAAQAREERWEQEEACREQYEKWRQERALRSGSPTQRVGTKPRDYR